MSAQNEWQPLTGTHRRTLARRFWHDAQWWLIGALFATTLVTGVIGFRDYEAAVVDGQVVVTMPEPEAGAAR